MLHLIIIQTIYTTTDYNAYAFYLLINVYAFYLLIFNIALYPS